ISENEAYFRPSTLHPEYGIPEVDIRELVDAVHIRGLQALQQSLDPKVRRNVLLTILTERMWEFHERAEAASPDTFGLLPSTCDQLHRTAPGSDVLAKIIREFDTTTKIHLIENADLCAVEPDAILEELQRRTYIDSQGKVQIPYPDRFREGLKNANTASWQSIHVLPHVFHRQRGQEVVFAMEKYRHLANTNIAMLRHLANTQLQIFSAAHGAMRFGEDFPEFSPEFLTIIGENGAERMELQLFVAKHIAMFRDKITTSVATGCPALFAKASNGKDVVTALYEWILRIADKFFFPHAEKILERSGPFGSSVSLPKIPAILGG